jgi:hypothetical protein
LYFILANQTAFVSTTNAFFLFFLFFKKSDKACSISFESGSILLLISKSALANCLKLMLGFHLENIILHLDLCAEYFVFYFNKFKDFIENQGLVILFIYADIIKNSADNSPKLYFFSTFGEL